MEGEGWDEKTGTEGMGRLGWKGWDRRDGMGMQEKGRDGRDGKIGTERMDWDRREEEDEKRKAGRQQHPIPQTPWGLPATSARPPGRSR